MFGESPEGLFNADKQMLSIVSGEAQQLPMYHLKGLFTMLIPGVSDSELAPNAIKISSSINAKKLRHYKFFEEN